MTPDQNLSPDLAQLEAALAALRPQADRLSRDRIFFEAGRADVLQNLPQSRRRKWGWPAAFSAMSAVALTLAVLLAFDHESQNRAADYSAIKFVYRPSKSATDDEPNADRLNKNRLCYLSRQINIDDAKFLRPPAASRISLPRSPEKTNDDPDQFKLLRMRMNFDG